MWAALTGRAVRSGRAARRSGRSSARPAPRSPPALGCRPPETAEDRSGPCEWEIEQRRGVGRGARRGGGPGRSAPRPRSPSRSPLVPEPPPFAPQPPPARPQGGHGGPPPRFPTGTARDLCFRTSPPPRSLRPCPPPSASARTAPLLPPPGPLPSPAPSPTSLQPPPPRLCLYLRRRRDGAQLAQLPSGPRLPAPSLWPRPARAAPPAGPCDSASPRRPLTSADFKASPIFTLFICVFKYFFNEFLVVFFLFVFLAERSAVPSAPKRRPLTYFHNEGINPFHAGTAETPQTSLGLLLQHTGVEE